MNYLWGATTSLGEIWLRRVSNWWLGSPSSSTVAQKANWTRVRRGPSFMWETRRWKTSWSVFWIAQSRAENEESADLATGSSLQKSFAKWYCQIIPQWTFHHDLAFTWILLVLAIKAPAKKEDKCQTKCILNRLGHPAVAELHKVNQFVIIVCLPNSTSEDCWGNTGESYCFTNPCDRSRGRWSFIPSLAAICTSVDSPQAKAKSGSWKGTFQVKCQQCLKSGESPTSSAGTEWSKLQNSVDGLPFFSLSSIILSCLCLILFGTSVKLARILSTARSSLLIAISVGESCWSPVTAAGSTLWDIGLFDLCLSIQAFLYKGRLLLLFLTP